MKGKNRINQHNKQTYRHLLNVTECSEIPAQTPPFQGGVWGKTHIQTTWAVKTLTPSPPNKCLSVKVLVVLQCRSKQVKMLSKCQTDWIRVRHRVTRRLTRSKLFAYGTIVVISRLRVSQNRLRGQLCNVLSSIHSKETACSHIFST